MKKVYIHIGLHKTATKFLQVDVFPALPDIRYLPKHHYERWLINELFHCDYQLFATRKDSIRKRLCDLAGESESLLISNELFSGNPFFRYSTRYLCLLKLKDLFPEAKIIIAIRGQKSMIDSLYREYVTQGGTKKFPDFIRSEILPGKSVLCYDPALDLNAFKYSLYLREIEKLFGKDNLYVFPYEMIAGDSELLFQQLGDFLKTKLEPHKFSSAPRHRSLNNSCLNMLRLLNHWHYSAFHHAGFLPHRLNPGHLLKKLPFSGVNRTKQTDYAFLDGIDYAEDNDRLDCEYNLALRQKYANYYYPAQ